MQSIFAALDARYASAAACADALGISRQALHQARKRCRLSARITIRAAKLLALNPANEVFESVSNALPDAERALLVAALEITAPEGKTAPDLPHQPPRQPDVDSVISTSLYYVKKTQQSDKTDGDAKKITGDELTCINGGNPCGSNNPDPEADSDISQVIHTHPTKIINKEAIEIIQWCMAVPKIQADSPRFCYYVANWRVPEKIAFAKENGTFEERIRDCPPIDPAWVRFVPAALEAYRAATAPQPKPDSTTTQHKAAQSSSKSGKPRNRTRLAA